MTSGRADEEAPAIQVILDHSSVDIPTEPLRQILEAAIREQGADVINLSIILTDRETVHDLNRNFLRHDFPTDVLSFPLNDEPDGRVIDAEVYIDLDTAVERAPEFNSDPRTEAYRYAIHGTLHLLGFDDETEEQRQIMRRREDQLLARLGER